jgi:hypothetical protein
MKDYKKQSVGTTPTKTRRSLVVTSIVFSKNRPLQLDLTLKTISKNFDQCTKVIVIYAADSEYLEAYDILKKEHPEVDWRLQTGNLYRMLYCALSFLDCENEFVCFFTDDCIVYRNVPDLSSALKHLQENVQMKCISLRLGFNVDSRQIEDSMIQDVPSPPVYGFGNEEQFIIFSHFQNCYGSYWCYPMSVDGHIFLRSKIKNVVNELLTVNIQIHSQWPQNPNSLEQNLQKYTTIDGCFTICPVLSCVVNSPNNKVQAEWENRSGDHYQYKTEFLLNEFNNGKRIDFDSLGLDNVRCPHTEINLLKGLL